MSRFPSVLLAGALALLPASPLAAGPDRWTSLGPDGGSIVRFAASPSTPGTVWAVSALGTVYRTTDGAATWKQVTIPVPAQGPAVTDLVAAPGSPAKAWLLGAEGVFVTEDGGTTWRPAGTGSAPVLYDLAVSPAHPDRLYASGPEGIYRRTDGGWERIAEMEYPWGLTVSPVDPETLLAFSGSLLRRTRDGGATWEDVPSLTSEIPSRIAFDRHRPAILYAHTYLKGLVRSEDRGESWLPLAKPGSGNSFYPEALLPDPHSPGTLWVSGYFFTGEGTVHGLWKSEDRGDHWTMVLSGHTVRDLVVDSRSGVLAGVPQAGILRSQHGDLQWAPAHRGIRARAVDEAAVAADGTLWIGAVGEPSPFLYDDKNSLLRSRDGGTTWEEIYPWGRGGVRVTGIAISPSSPDTVHVALYGGAVRSVDGGQTWAFQNQGLRLGEALLDIALAPSLPSVVYTVGVGSPFCDSLDCGRSQVFRSTNGGAEWRRARLRLPRLQGWGSLLVHPAHHGTVWLGGFGLYRSTDMGLSWTLVGSGLEGYVLDLAADPTAPNTLYAVRWSEASRKVFKSLDGGLTWSPASRGLPPVVAVSDLAMDPVRPSTLYAATRDGVYVTDDEGSRWRPLGLKDRAALTVAVDPSDPRTVYAGTLQGLFVLTRSDR